MNNDFLPYVPLEESQSDYFTSDNGFPEDSFRANCFVVRIHDSLGKEVLPEFKVISCSYSIPNKEACLNHGYISLNCRISSDDAHSIERMLDCNLCTIEIEFLDYSGKGFKTTQYNSCDLIDISPSLHYGNPSNNGAEYCLVFRY